MKLRNLPSVTLGLLGVVAYLIIVLLVLTGQHNAQLKAQTEVHNGQRVSQTAAFHRSQK